MNYITTKLFCKWLVLLLLCCIPAEKLCARESSENHTVNAELLLQQCDKARDKSQYGELARLSGRLLNYARLHNNKRCEAYALFYKGLAELFMGKGSKAVVTLKKSQEIAEDIGNDSVKALVMNALGIYQATNKNNSFVAQQYFLKSLNFAEQAKYDVLKRRVMGNMIILTHTQNDTTGLSNAFQIYDYGVENQQYELMYMGAYYIAMYHHLRGENEKAVEYIHRSLKLYDEYKYDDISSVYTLYSQIMVASQDYKAAGVYAQKAIRLAHELKQVTILSDAYLQYAKVLNLEKKYQESNRIAFICIEKAAKVGNRTNIASCYELIAQNFKSIGDHERTIEYLEKASNTKDTLNTVNMERLIHERKLVLDMEKKEQEAILRKEQITAKNRLIIVLTITALILIGMLAIIIANYRKRNRLYKNIVQQNAKAVTRQKELLHRISELENMNAGDRETDEEQDVRKSRLNIDEDKMQQLYDQLCQLMEEEKLYADQQLNREKLAEQLGTNRTYLSQIIKEKSGMSYLQFINSYRINEAIRILSDKTLIDYPLKQICADIGFNSPTTFYKFFQQSVGITPSFYRKQFIDLEKNNGAEDDEE